MNRLENISDFNQLHFLRPEFLWLLVPLAIIYLIAFIIARNRISWLKHISPHLRKVVIIKGSETKQRIYQTLSLIFISIGILGLAGPTWSYQKKPESKVASPMAVVLDLSSSMELKDIQPTRYERAQFKIKDLMDENPGALCSFIGYAGTAHVITPMTSDYEIIRSHLKTLKTDVMPYPGSNLKEALDSVSSLFGRFKAPGTAVIFTDAISIVNLSLLKAYEDSSKMKFILVPMVTENGESLRTLKKSSINRKLNETNELSYLNQELLNQFENLKNVQISRLTLDASDMEQVAKNIRTNLDFTIKPKTEKSDWKDQGIYFIIPLLIFFLFWFRRGMVIICFTGLIMNSCQTENTKDWWYTQDYQAQKLYNSGKYEESAQLFSDPMRKGVANFKAGKYFEAMSEFEKDSSAESQYNLSITYYQLGDYQRAKIALNSAIEADPELNIPANYQQNIDQLIDNLNEVSLKDAMEDKNKEGKRAQNEQNKSPEDLSGGGQKATKKQMEKKRLEENVTTDIRKGKELDELPVNFQAGPPMDMSKILMQKVDDDPSVFLKRKFKYQIKKRETKPDNKGILW